MPDWMTHKLESTLLVKISLCWQSHGLSSSDFSMVFHGFSHVFFFDSMWKLVHNESWVPKNWCFQTVVLEKTLESPLDFEENKPVSPKGNQSWIFIRRTDAEAPILWSPDVKSWLIGKVLDVGKDWGPEEKGVTENEMVIWHHQLNGRVWLVAQSCPNLWTIAHQALLSTGFPRHEYWSGLPCCPPGDLPNPGIEPRSPELQVNPVLPNCSWVTRETSVDMHLSKFWEIVKDREAWHTAVPRVAKWETEPGDWPLPPYQRDCSTSVRH